MPRRADKVAEKARSALEKPAPIGSDVPISRYKTEAPKHSAVPDPEALPQEDRSRMLEVGVTPRLEERAATYIQMDESVVYSSSNEGGVEVLSIGQALEKYEWLSDYYWNALEVDTDKYTAIAEVKPGGGYFIRVKEGYKAKRPVQSCLYISTDSLAQRVHNIIIVEPNAELHVITGCATSRLVSSGLHVGASEFYVKSGGKLSYTMIHNWGKAVAVRPRTAAVVEDGATFLSNYICLEPAATLQMYPTTYLTGRESVARFYSLLMATPGSELDVGSRIVLEGRGSRAEIVSRSVSRGGTIVARGLLEGRSPGVKGHLECNGLILSDEGLIHAVPELRGTLKDVDLSHEAAVGKISEEEIHYLMARGLSEDEATSAIVRGFLDVRIEGLPAELQSYIKSVVESGERKASM